MSTSSKTLINDEAATPAPRVTPQIVAEQIRHRHSAAMSALALSPCCRAWTRTRSGRAIRSALECMPGACDEIDRLTWLLAMARRAHQNLAAAARASLAAAGEGEHDPLYYLRDELEAQGLVVGRHGEPR